MDFSSYDDATLKSLLARSSTGDSDKALLEQELASRKQMQDQAAINETLQRQMAQSRNSPMGIAQSLVEGVTNPIYGLSQVAYNGANEIAPGLVDMVESADGWLYDNTSGWLGSPGGDVNQQVSDRANMMEANTGYGRDELNPVELLGEIGPALAIGGPALAAGKGVYSMGNAARLSGAGSAGGASIPIDDYGEDYWAKVGINSGVGATLGLAVPPLAAAATNKLLKNVVSPEMDLLREMGVSPSVGQQIGGAVNDFEQKLTSVPIVGGAISSVREGARDAWRDSTVQRAVDPVGAKVPGATADMQGAMADSVEAISEAYTRALSDIGGFRISDVTSHSLDRLHETVNKSALTDDQVSAFNRFWEGNIQPRIEGGGITAQTYKTLDSELASAIAEVPGELKGAFMEVKSIFGKQVAKDFPSLAPQIKAADKAYSNWVRVNKAAASSMGRDGNFGPGQLTTAIRSSDKTAQKKATTTGSAPMSAEARAGRRLTDTVPNSGTADRTMQAAALMGGGSAVSSLGTDGIAMLAPYLIAGGLGALVSSSPAQKLASKALRSSANAASKKNPAFHIGVLADELGEEEDDWFYGKLTR